MRFTRGIKGNIIALAFVVTVGVATVGAADEMDPLLRLLVAKGVITQEEAVALQAESKAMEAAEAVAEPVEAPQPEPEEKKKASWTDRVDIYGDMRLRYEGFNQDGGFYNDRRDRFRIRLRPGVRFTITDWMKVGVQLRNGDPDDPVSNNTSFDGGFQFKSFNLAEGYLQIKPSDRLAFIGGKFDAKNWWTVTDMQWDDDVTVEGLMSNVGLASGEGIFKNLDLVAYAYILEESKSGPDAWTYGGQLRSDFRLGDKNALQVGVGYDLWTYPQEIVDLTLDGSLKGNKITNFLDENNQLISDFEILNAFAQFKNKSIDGWPISLKLFYYKNLGAKGIGADNDTGSFGRLQVGDYKTKWQLAFRYSYYYSEPDALFYVFTQSDTGRSSDVKAHRFDLRFGAWAKSYFNVTYYNTRPVYREDEPLDRWQFDYIVKF